MGTALSKLFSVVVVLWRFRAGNAGEDAESRAARKAGALLFALATFVAVTSVTSLLGYSEPKPTLLGIAILVAAAAVMPWLAREKRRLSGTTGSAALRADAALEDAFLGVASGWRNPQLQLQCCSFTSPSSRSIVSC